MGTWGMTTFENDDALDWLAELEDEGGLTLLRQSFQPEEIQGYYLEAPQAVRLLCAAEILAAALGRPALNLPADAIAWVHRHAGLDFASLRELALAKIDRVLAKDSELYELWEENTEDFPTWISTVTSLRDRLSNPSTGSVK